MATHIAVNVAGVWAFDGDGKVVAWKPFPKESALIALRIADWEAGRSFPELEEVRNSVKDAVVSRPNPAEEMLSTRGRKLAIEKGWVKDDSEFNKFLTAVGAARAKLAISSKERRDRLIVQAVSALSDLDKILNSMSERLREWYGLHYPEWKPAEHDKYARLVAEQGMRENIPGFKGSMGMKIADEDLKELKGFAAELRNMFELRKSLEKYLNGVVPVEMPNISALLGAVLAARLLAQAGTLERLAKMPSSTIQLLGAEKALFRALKENRGNRRGEQPRVPRFGIIFTHPDISGAPDQMRGKIARLLAAKLSVAARMDFYSKEDHGAQLVEDYRKKLAEARKG